MNAIIFTGKTLSSLCCILLFLLICMDVSAQATDTIYLWPGEVPGESEPKHPPIQTDNTTGNVVRLTNVTDPAMIVFEPIAKNDSGLGVIICPGGGHQILAIDKEGYEIAEWFGSHGYTAFVLQYRVPQKQEGALMDLQKALQIVRSKTSQYGLDPEKIGVLGFSAGGSLCARASTTNTSTPLDQRPNFTMLVYPASLDNGENRQITPELVITEETPPFFIFGTADDRHGNSALVMATALRDHKVPAELHLMPSGGHGYGLRPGNIAGETWPDLALKWLKRR